VCRGPGVSYRPPTDCSVPTSPLLLTERQVATSPRLGLVRCPLDCPNLRVNSLTRSVYSAPNRSVWSDLVCRQGPPAFGPSQSTPRSPRLLPAPCSALRPAPQTTGPDSQQSQRPAPGPRPQRPKCPSVNWHHCGSDAAFLVANSKWHGVTSVCVGYGPRQVMEELLY
jgi:hypothetical protein